MKRLAVCISILMVFAAAGIRARTLDDFRGNGERGNRRPTLIFNMRGFAFAGESGEDGGFDYSTSDELLGGHEYELLRVGIVGPPKLRADSYGEESDEGVDTDEMPELRGKLGLAEDGYVLTNIDIVLEEVEFETFNGDSKPGKRISSLSATICVAPEEAPADGEEQGFEECGEISLDLTEKEFGRINRPAAYGELTIYDDSYRVWGLPLRRKLVRAIERDGAEDLDIEEEDGDVVEEENGGI